MAENDPNHSELATFGEELRREREIRGISLKEIADATKISKRFLEAIERNDHKTLPAPVFTRGFVREYARYLGLNAEEMVSRYNYAAAGDDRIEQSPHLERLVQPPSQAAPAREMKPRGIPPPYARIDRNIYLLVLIAAALIGVAWWALRYKREARAESVDTVHTTSSASRSTTPAAAAPKPAPQQAAADDRLHLTLVVNENAWIKLKIDDEKSFVINDELKAGDRRTIDAKERFLFDTIGNAGGIALTINDVPVPPLGGAGKVRHDITFDRQWLTEHRTTP